MEERKRKHFLSKHILKGSDGKRIAIGCLFLFTLATTAAAQERGIASYYARNMQGRRMSSGLRYHNDSMFCAHKKHPFGTLLKVVNTKTKKSVIVKVTDRGPFGRGRIVDLSYGAAKALGIIAAGIAPVEVSVYHPDEKGVPYLNEHDPKEKPELDFGVTEIEPDPTPVWQQDKPEMQPTTPAPDEKKALEMPAEQPSPSSKKATQRHSVLE